MAPSNKLSNAALTHPLNKQDLKGYTKQPSASRHIACQKLANIASSVSISNLIKHTYLANNSRQIRLALIRSLIISIARGKPTRYGLTEEYENLIILLFNQYVYQTASKIAIDYEKASEIVVLYNKLNLERIRENC